MLSLTGRLPVRIDLRPDRKSDESQDATADRRLIGDEELCSGLTRSQIVDRILAMNPSATTDFLERFDVRSLGAYLDHLTVAAQPRGRSARWIRPAGGCGISWSERRN